MSVTLWLTAVVLFCAMIGYRDWKQQKRHQRFEERADKTMEEVETRLRRISKVRKITDSLPPEHKIHGVG